MFSNSFKAASNSSTKNNLNGTEVDYIESFSRNFSHLIASCSQVNVITNTIPCVCFLNAISIVPNQGLVV